MNCRQCCSVSYTHRLSPALRWRGGPLARMVDRGPPGLDGVARTAYDASRGKVAAVARGYFGDDFAHCFCAEGPSPGPLINRGHYVRVAAIGSVCEQFLHAARGQQPQIVSIGAGFDTRFWQLAAAGMAPSLYIEVDQHPMYTPLTISPLFPKTRPSGHISW